MEEKDGGEAEAAEDHGAPSASALATANGRHYCTEIDDLQAHESQQEKNADEAREAATDLEAQSGEIRSMDRWRVLKWVEMGEF